jgi:hypothetical protein
MIIAKPLLEHYLRATKWKPYAPDIPPSAGWFQRAGLMLDPGHHHFISDAIEAIAHVENRTEPEVAACLGLCAAAEQSFEHTASFEAAAEAMDPGMANRDALIMASAARDLAEVLLKLAGIDPSSWEEARRG